MALYHPLLFAIDAERAHRLTIRALAVAGSRTGRIETSPRLAQVVAGIRFPNPAGLAAGVDKDGEAVAGFFGLTIADRAAFIAGSRTTMISQHWLLPQDGAHWAA